MIEDIPAAGWIGGRGDQQLRDQPVGRQAEGDLRDAPGVSPTPVVSFRTRNPYKSPDRLAAQLENA
jgi:hypothetical protein